METVLYMGLVNWLATWIWVDGEVFREVRQLVDDNAPRYLGARLGEKCKYLVHCPLCAGTWIGFGLSLLVPGPLAPIAGSIIGWFLNGFTVQGCWALDPGSSDLCPPFSGDPEGTSRDGDPGSSHIETPGARGGGSGLSVYDVGER